MTPDAKVLLEKLLRTRPKPDERALTELFMAIKASPIQDLLKLVRGGNVPATDGLQDLEAATKKRLRQVGGKAADFAPYILDAIASRKPDARIKQPKALTLGKAVALAMDALGSDASAALDAAFKVYVDENDVSYRLKSA